MGNAEAAMDTAEFLIDKAAANPNLRCRWNDMNALHIATYYDVAPVVGYLVTVVSADVIDQSCAYLESKTPLHIAATNLCLKSAKVLLGAGANVLLKDRQDRTPLDCVPDDEQLENSFVWAKNKYQDIALELRTILEEATLTLSGEQSTTDMETLKTAKVVLSALGFEIGDRVVVGNAKVGILRYCGKLDYKIVVSKFTFELYRTNSVCIWHLDWRRTGRYVNSFDQALRTKMLIIFSNRTNRQK